jgi:tight adherence protein B
VKADYQTLKARTPARTAPAHHPAPVRHAAGPSFAGSTLLSPTPSFASAAPPAAPAVNHTFWASSSAVAVIAGICALFIALGLALALHRPSKQAVRARVGTFIPLAEEESDVAGAREPPQGLFSRLQRGSWWPPFVEAVAISRSPHAPAYLVKRAAAIAMVVAVVAVAASGAVPLGLGVLIVWPFVLRALVNRAAEKQRAKFRDTLPTYLQDMASAIRVGRSFAGAVAVVASNADEPTRSELDRAATDEALGLNIEDTLEAVAERMQSTDMGQVALIAGLNRRTGSNVAEALDRVAEGARERGDLRREMGALTSQAKMSSSVLTGLPLVLLGALSLVSPQYAHPLFHTTLGIVAMGFGGALVFAGWKVMSKITRIEV